MEENTGQNEQEVEDEMTRQRRIRFDAERMGETMFSKETRDHLVRASTEIVLAVDSMIPRDMVPEDVKQHYLAAKRETLMLVRSLLDAQINMVQDLETKKEPPEAGLRKIALD
ncbi:MAG: hypothetical protein SA339_12930 [Methanomassiliicoccus sp.]|nr:hypothetical protein [Methanomassiliicoccus sp.]